MAVDQELTGEDAQYDYRDFIADVDDNEGFEFISADKQQLEKARAMMAPAFQGGRKQVDKKVNEMTADEREVFETLDGDEVNDFRLPGYEVYGEQKAESKLRVPKEKVTYEAIADDLIAQLNGGMPALDKAGPEPVRKEPQPSTGGMPMARIENYKERMEGVLAMLEKAEEFKGAAAAEGQKQSKVDNAAKGIVNQSELDAVFGNYMQAEYADDQIGDLEGQMDDVEDLLADEEVEDYGELSDMEMEMTAGVEPVDQTAMIQEAVDEFIEDKKDWFRGLHKQHGEKDVVATAMAKGADFKEGTAMHIPKCPLPVTGAKEDEEQQRMLKERTLHQFSDKDTDEEESSDHEPEFDAETILTTLTNTDNHPHVIKYVPKVKPNSNAIMLDKQFKVPVGALDGLIPTAEEISKKKAAKKAKKTD